MREFSAGGRGAQAIICVDSSTGLWKRLRQFLEEQECQSEFILALAPETSTDILVLCRRLIPALLVIEDAKLDILPFRELRDFLTAGDVQILVLTDKVDDASYEYFFHKGCAGTVPTNVADDTLLKAIHAIIAGEVWMPRKIISKLARDNSTKSTLRALTSRESEIFKLICRGHTNQQIADQLFISRETVRWHVRSIYSKVGVDNRMGAIRGAKAFLKESEPGSDQIADE